MNKLLFLETLETFKNMREKRWVLMVFGIFTELWGANLGFPLV